MELGTITQETTVTAAEELVRTVDASQGEVIEEGEAQALFDRPRESYTKALLAAAHLA